jgi:hypothetical protein
MATAGPPDVTFDPNAGKPLSPDSIMGMVLRSTLEAGPRLKPGQKLTVNESHTRISFAFSIHEKRANHQNESRNVCLDTIIVTPTTASDLQQRWSEMG